jgi:hypothetical protein
MMGGALLGAGLGFSAIILLLAVPALLASISIFAMFKRYPRSAAGQASLTATTAAPMPASN